MVASAFFLSLLGLAQAPPPVVLKDTLRTDHDRSPLTVSTSSGHINGKIDIRTPNVRQFLGIPYARSPTGDRRWLPAQKLEQPQAQIDATHLPVSCMQYLSKTPSVYNQEILEFNLQGLNQTGSISEDCLTLSIWTPHIHDSANNSAHWPYKQDVIDKADLVPVFIYFYGGAFLTGGEDVPYQIPSQWVQRTQDHIVVTLNYRTSIFGFPLAEGLDDQNLGILDQRAAVEWVQKNIAGFGGDPDRMVLWGQSAGSVSVDYYNFAWADDPIVKGLIMDSGTAQTAYSGTDVAVLTGPLDDQFSVVAENVGCSGLSSDPAALLKCMRGVDARVINDFLANHDQSGASPKLYFRMHADERVIFSNYTDLATTGKEAGLPAIIGTNSNEGVAFAPYSPEGPNPAIAEFVKLQVFFCPATETSRLRQQHSRTTYRYSYNGNFTNVSPAPWMGAYHASELPMIFGTHPNYRGPSTDLEYATSEAMQDAYLAFARDPFNGPQALGWKPYTALGQGDVREFGNGVAAQDISVDSEEAKCNGNLPTGA